MMMSGDGIISDEFASIAGPAVEGTLMTFAPDPRKRPEAAEIVKKFTDAGFDPEAYTLYTYAAMQIAARQPPRRSARTTRQKVAETCMSGGTVQDRDRRYRLRREGRHHPSGLRLYTWKKQADGKITYVTELIGAHDMNGPARAIARVFLPAPMRAACTAARFGAMRKKPMTNGMTIRMKARLTASPCCRCSLLRALPHAEILIGAAAPFSGPNAALGEQLRRGAQMAVDDINATGGIRGETARPQIRR